MKLYIFGACFVILANLIQVECRRKQVTSKHGPVKKQPHHLGASSSTWQPNGGPPASSIGFQPVQVTSSSNNFQGNSGNEWQSSTNEWSEWNQPRETGKNSGWPAGTPEWHKSTDGPQDESTKVWSQPGGTDNWNLDGSTPPRPPSPMKN